MQAIIDWSSPRNIFEVRIFHGLESFYKKFINNFNGICAYIGGTIKKDRQPFQWTTEAERSFHFLKKKITEKPILKLIDFNHSFQVKCDSSGVVIRTVLSHKNRPIVYFSEKLNDVKKKYSSHERSFMLLFKQ